MCLGSIGRIERVWDEGGIPMAMVRSDGKAVPANLLYAPDARVDDDVLVQFGFVIERLERARAADARAIREQLASTEG